MDEIANDGEKQTTETSQTKSSLRSQNDNKEKEAEKDPELDITSESFNPLKALYAPEYRITEKQPKIIYQNMAAFETALKKVGIMGLGKKPKNTEASGSKDVKNKNPFMVTEETTQRRFQQHQMALKTEAKVKNKHRRNLMRQIEQAEGPLKHIQLLMKQERTVKVLLRKEHGIKGYVEGVIKLFDRHWNLLMVDVLECLEQRKYKYVEDKLVMDQELQDCSYRLKQLGIALPQQSVKSLSRKRVEIRRHLPQLLIRGEHVVLISAKGSAG